MSIILKFNDLPQSEKDSLIETYSTPYFEWYEEVISDFAAEMKEKYGITISETDVQFSGFSSQGDGASFTVSQHNVNIVKFLKTSNFAFNMEQDVYEFLSEFTEVKNFYETIAKDYISLSIVRTSNQYCHENTVTAYVEDCTPDYDLIKEEFSNEYDIQKRLINFLRALESHWEAFTLEKCRDIYQRLEHEYEAAFGYGAVVQYLSEKSYNSDFEIID